MSLFIQQVSAGVFASIRGTPCRESVPVDQTSNTTLLPWLHGLKDALSRTTDNPDGLDLKVDLCSMAVLFKCYESKLSGWAR